MTDAQMDKLFSATIMIKSATDETILLARCCECAAIVADLHRTEHADFHIKLRKLINGS